MNIPRSDRFLSVLAMLAPIALFCGTASAAPLQNGGFETGTFTPWTTTGTATVTGTSNGVAPAEGSFQAVLNTPSGGTVFQGSMETFLGLAGGSLSTYNSGGGSGGGSAFKQTFDITAGQILTFRWNFLPNGSNASNGQNDTAFFTLHLAGDTSSTAIFTLASTASTGGVATGYQTYMSGPLAAGTYLLGFADYDQKMVAGAFNAQRPTLLIDGVAVVPEPATVTLLAFGAIGGAACWFRRRRS
jgi:hypothetical protein